MEIFSGKKENNIKDALLFVKRQSKVKKKIKIKFENSIVWYLSDWSGMCSSQNSKKTIESAKCI